MLRAQKINARTGLNTIIATSAAPLVMVNRHTHEWGDSGACVHCGRLTPILAAETRSSNALAMGNHFKELGQTEKANKCYERSAFWLMRANELRGW